MKILSINSLLTSGATLKTYQVSKNYTSESIRHTLEEWRTCSPSFHVLCVSSVRSRSIFFLPQKGKMLYDEQPFKDDSLTISY